MNIIAIEWTSTFNATRPAAPRSANFETAEAATRFAKRLALTAGTLKVQITTADGIQSWERVNGSWVAQGPEILAIA